MDVEFIINQVRGLESLKWDKEVAALLGAEKTAVSVWKQRGNIPNRYLIEYATKKNVSLDWLIFGLGSPQRSETQIQDSGSASYNITVKPEALYQAAEQLYAACDRAGTRPAPAGFKLMLKNLAGVILAGGAVSDEEVDQLVADLLRVQQQSADQNEEHHQDG